MRSNSVSRRDLFAYAAAAAVVGATAAAAPASARSALGTLIDYAGGIPSATAIRDAGHIGVIRYVSDRRPGAEWMAGKPLRSAEVDDLKAAGLQIVSCYQFGKGPTADWRGGLEAGKRHAERGLALHRAAGGPDNVPIYASIDDNPSAADFATMIAPYLLGWQSVLGTENTGVYANTPTIELARAAGLGSWYWQHNWGTPKGFVHPAANLHQFEIDKQSIDGVGIDVNNVLTPEYGQW
ncbi:glycoside hydrolase domain-containing protein [Nocardia sp. R7R-8]|uniref:glycoside hydrolase domain-containing protein n=1 Tax=Nocardia sp. R7R-8 TaxID=3459304 RepID=UPI00403E20D0